MGLMQTLFGKSKLEKQFDATLSVKIGVNDRVRHRTTRLLGTVTQTGLVKGTIKVPTVTVAYDNGQEAVMVPAEEFMKATRF